METPTLEHMTVSPEGTRLGFIGSHGYVHIADSNSKQWIVDFKMNCTLRSMSFLNENTCITSGYDAEIYLWDIRYPNGKCISKFNHEDGTATSFISSYLPPAAINQTSSGKQQNNFFALTSPYLSIGALSGVNSVFEGSYDNQSGYYQFSPSNVVGATPKPLKSIMNLTTRISQSAFHPSGQILAIASNVVSLHL
jgi:WD40 repeat protein